jgi:hypothetical protein
MNDHEWAALREHDGYLAALEVDKADGVFRCRLTASTFGSPTTQR